MKKIITTIIIASTIFIAGCQDDVDVANDNITKAADNFEVNRRIIFYNGITNQYMLEIRGICSLQTKSDLDGTNQRLWVTCLVGKGKYKRHHLGLSDNVTYFAEQLEPSKVSAYHYRVTFKPQTILPDFDVRASTTDGPQNQQ